MREDIRNQVQDGQHRANEIITMIDDIISELPRIAAETFKEELRYRLEKITAPKINCIK